jgi:hypothetical protein
MRLAHEFPQSAYIAIGQGTRGVDSSLVFMDDVATSFPYRRRKLTGVLIQQTRRNIA